MHHHDTLKRNAWGTLLRFACLGAILGAGLAGCGSSGAPNQPEPTPTPAPAPPRLWVLAGAGQSLPLATRLFYSDDLGATWTEPTPGGLGDGLRAIDFIDRLHGVAVGGPRALRTVDGGETWTTQLSDDRRAPEESLDLVDVHLREGGEGVAMANLVNESFLNALGFESWSLPADGSAARRGSVSGSAPAPLVSMCLTDQGIGLAAGSFRFTMALTAVNSVLETTDGGATWAVDQERSAAGGALGWEGVTCAGSRDLWLLGTSSAGGVIVPMPARVAIARSSDGGVTWTSPGVLEREVDGGVSTGHFATTRTGWLGGFERVGGAGVVRIAPLVLRTDDGGDTWQVPRLPEEVRGGIQDIAFADESVGAAVVFGGSSSSGPGLLVSEDGGETWRAVALPSGVEYALRVDAVP